MILFDEIPEFTHVLVFSPAGVRMLPAVFSRCVDFSQSRCAAGFTHVLVFSPAGVRMLPAVFSRCVDFSQSRCAAG